MDADTRGARLLNARLIKERIQAVGCAIVGVGMIVLGIFSLNDDEVMCGSQAMEAGEVCEETKNGEVTAERGLEEQADDNTLTGWLITGGGVAMIVGSSFWAVGAFTRKKRVTADEAAAGLTPATVHKARKENGTPPQQQAYAHAAPQYPPQPGHSQPSQPHQPQNSHQPYPPPAPYQPHR
ncbi:hypothetical protein [Prauserella rugosa]|uniref:Transmembrane protein n=1 Tax=Prauserella rugosa TaxID=43354 RepID=A0A660CJ11_9PSEU|nr:hypothetical protein [Prauserella rugosa]KMS88145.1 hypothetical protein ACZ91_27370 [Streptomyces regensis]TWH21837.1 hypothetical protein JD82_03706 [Prauserella rugosa]